jgi:hypothetical protein
MGKNKQRRKRIAGLLQVAAIHERKIEAESRKPAPNSGRIRKWQREIDIAMSTVRKFRKQLEK